MAGLGPHLGEAGNGGVEIKRAGLQGIVRLLRTAQRKLLPDHGHLLLLSQILRIHGTSSMLTHCNHMQSLLAYMSREPYCQSANFSNTPESEQPMALFTQWHWTTCMSRVARRSE